MKYMLGVTLTAANFFFFFCFFDHSSRQAAVFCGKLGSGQLIDSHQKLWFLTF